jgi:hypothetical protein
MPQYNRRAFPARIRDFDLASVSPVGTFISLVVWSLMLHLQRSGTRIMSKRLTLLLLLSCLGRTARAQEQAPRLLREAAHCLATTKQDWLDLENSKATALNLGYLVDTKSYPGKTVLYVVEYLGPGRSEGMVFTIFLTQEDRRRVFDIQNNARFVSSGKAVDFVEPPLGGEWTQEHLVAAIKQIERRPKLVVHVKDLSTPSPATQCRSYADRK